MKRKSNRREFLAASAAAAASLTAGCARVGKPKQAVGNRPNVVVLVADDLGYSDVSCYGAPDIQTPNIDSLAREGTRFTDHYAAAPVCTPTRCALYTGCYPARSKGGLEYAIYCKGTMPIAAGQGLPPDEISIANMLKANGYATGIFGKWHLGYKPEFSPISHGFDEFFGFKSGNINYFTHKEVSGEPDLYDGDTPVEVEGYMTNLITAQAMDFIARRRKEPFALFVTYNAPHWPWQGPDDEAVEFTPETWNKKGDRATYVKMVEHMDHCIGHILGALAAYGLTENTLVIFISDNGGDSLSLNKPFKGMKRELWEGGIRAPCIFRWPGVVPAGRTTAQQSITMDLTATILDATETPVLGSRKLDGETLLPIVCRNQPEHDRPMFWRRKGQVAARNGDWKYVRIEGEGEFLYDLQTDVAEEKNLAQEFPEQLRIMQNLVKQWEADIGQYQWAPGSRWEKAPG